MVVGAEEDEAEGFRGGREVSVGVDMTFWTRYLSRCRDQVE